MLKQSQFEGKRLVIPSFFRFFSLFVQFRSIGSLAIASSLLLGGAFALVAQTPPAMKRLPPPPIPGAKPPLPSESTFRPSLGTPIAPARQSIAPSTPSPPLPVSTTVVREYTFQAPQAPPPRSRQARLAPYQPTQFKPAQYKPTQLNLKPKTTPLVLSSPVAPRTNFYRVEIPGTDETLLAQVKSVEPLAVVWNQQGVIYGGIFPEPQLAQERVHQLQKRGVSSKIVPLSRPK